MNLPPYRITPSAVIPFPCWMLRNGSSPHWQKFEKAPPGEWLADYSHYWPDQKKTPPVPDQPPYRIAEKEKAIWRAAITLAHNLCTQHSDRLNDEDNTEEAYAASKCAEKIRGWVTPTDEQLLEMFAEAGVPPDHPPAPTAGTGEANHAMAIHYTRKIAESSMSHNESELRHAMHADQPAPTGGVEQAQLERQEQLTSALWRFAHDLQNSTHDAKRSDGTSVNLAAVGRAQEIILGLFGQKPIQIQ